jgi:hypothetical protein
MTFLTTAPDVRELLASRHSRVTPKETPISCIHRTVGYEVLMRVCTLWRRENILPLPELNSDCLARRCTKVY